MSIQRQTAASLQSQTPEQRSEPAARLFDGYQRHPTAWDELFAGPGAGPRAFAPLVARLGELTRRGVPAAPRQRRPGLHQPGHHLLGLFRPPRRREDLPVRPDPARRSRPRSGRRWKPACSSGSRRSTCSCTTSITTGASLREGVVPEDLVLQSKGYRPEMIGFDPPGKQYIHVVGTDLIRDAAGQFLVLEDNGRTPSGVSYVLENRVVMKKVFPQLFQHIRVRRVEDYPQRLREALRSVAPPAGRRLAVRGPALARAVQLGLLRAQLPGPRTWASSWCSGQDLFVHDDRVYLKTTRGPQRVDVIYRRLDDDFLDPKAFRPDSLLGVPGLMSAYRAGNVTLANAVGTGVADDKAIYPFVEDMIRFYLSEEPILHNVADLHLRPPERPRLRPRSPRRAGGQGGQRVGRLRHADGAVVDRRRSATSSATRSGPTRATTSPSRSSRCRPARPGPRRGRAPARRPAAVHRQRHVDLGPARRPDADGPGRRGRWSSTPARAAAARTPG